MLKRVSDKKKSKIRIRIAINQFTRPIIAVVVVILAYVVYANFTPNSVSSQYFSSVQTVVGNGRSNTQIPVTVYSKLGTTMGGITVQASTDAGTVTGCKTDSNGQCSIAFTPPMQSTSSYASITVSVNEITQKISIKINPDPTQRLSLQSDNNNLPADGSSATHIAVKAYDDSNSLTFVPDGTQISFSLNPAGEGSLSSTTCTTVNGGCSVTYTSSTTPGNVNIQANSYSAIASVQVTLETLQPSSISLSSSASSVKGDGKSTAIITAKVTNKINNPVSYATVHFNVDLGSVEQACTTDSSGACSVTYTSPNQAGSAQIEGYVNPISGYANSIHSSATITLTPVASLGVQFSTPYASNQIVPAFALNHAYLNENMTSIRLTNTGSGTFTGTVTLDIPGWATSDSQHISMPPSSSTTIYLNPNLNSQAFSNLQERPITYQLTITDSNGILVYQNAYSGSITSFNTMDWGDAQTSNIITAWVTPGASVIHQLLSQAAQYLPGNSMQGYIKYPSGCGPLGALSCDELGTTYLQLQAIYNQLQAEGMHYVNAPQNFAGAQTVYTPTQSLAVRGANCIDGTLVFASALAATGMRPIIALVPGHAFVCVFEWSNSNTVLCVETTMIGEGSSFSDAYQVGNSEFASYLGTSPLNLIYVDQILSSGVKSLPS